MADFRGDQLFNPTVGPMGERDGKLDHLKILENFVSEIQAAGDVAAAKQVVSSYKEKHSDLSKSVDAQIRRLASQDDRIMGWMAQLLS